MSWAYDTPMSYDSNKKNQKYCWISHFFDFNSKPMLSGNDKITTSLFPTKEVSSIPKDSGTDLVQPVNLKVYANNKNHRIYYLVITCLTVSIKTIHDICFDTNTAGLHKHFVLCRIQDDLKQSVGTAEGATAPGTMLLLWLSWKYRKNQVLSIKHSIQHMVLNTSDSMTQKVLEACFEALMKL